ncbi:hypothetical protein AAC387_Pa05g2694 [Persea americana]
MREGTLWAYVGRVIPATTCGCRVTEACVWPIVNLVLFGATRVSLHWDFKRVSACTFSPLTIKMTSRCPIGKKCPFPLPRCSTHARSIIATPCSWRRLVSLL